MFHTPAGKQNSMQSIAGLNVTKVITRNADGRPIDGKLLKLSTPKPDKPLYAFDRFNASNGSQLFSGDATNRLEQTPTPAYARKDFIYCTPPLKNISSKYREYLIRDLGSPSAAARVRARLAMKNPANSNYYNFDVSHEEIDIITHEERQSRPKTIQEVMRNVVIYVEIRNADDNRTAGVKNIISGMGARVNDKLLRNTTHVIFKDGLQSTYNKAKNWNLPIVSLSWMEACKKHLILVDPKDYEISDVHRYENPELYEKIKRYKYKQPGGEDNTKSAKSRRSFICQRPEAFSPKILSPYNSTNNENISMDESGLNFSESGVLSCPKLMNATNSIAKRSSRRHTVFGSYSIDETRVTERTPVQHQGKLKARISNADDSSASAQKTTIPGQSTTTSNAKKASLDEDVTALSAKKAPNANTRRTIFNISKDVLSKRIEILNGTTSKHCSSSVTMDSLTNSDNLNKDNGRATDAKSCTPLPTKRKLFTPPTPMPLPKLIRPTSKRIREDDIQSNTIKKIRSSDTTAPSSHTCTDDPPTTKKTDIVLRRSTRRSTLNFREKLHQKTVHPSKPKCSESVIVFTNMHQQQIDVIEKAVSLLGKFKIEGTVTSKTSHLVSLEPRRTLNLMRALIRGVWILNFDWILASIESNQWKNEELFEMGNFAKAVKICRMERQLFGNNYKMNLFSDVGAIYLTSRSKYKDLREIIRLCCGKLTNNYMDAAYIVGEYFPECGSNICLSPNWIIDSIVNAQIVLTDLYCVTPHIN